MKYLSVCSGIEAATVAWHSLGWEPLAFSEIEKFPRKVLGHHYPNVPLHGDFTVLREQEWIKDADILVGGTPCQAFSVAGLRNSLDDDRGNLTLEFVRLADAIDNLRPTGTIIVWENVPGVLSVKDNAFGCFLAALVGNDEPLVPTGGKWTNAGMVMGPQRRAAWRVLDAQYFGVAQRRRRLFVVASARTDIDPAEILFEREGMRRNTPPSRETGENVAATIAARFGNSRNNHEEVTIQSVGEVAPTLTKEGTGVVRPGFQEDGWYVAIKNGSHWDGDQYPHPTLMSGAKSTGGVGYSNQEVFSQRGAYLAPVAARMVAFGEYVDDGTASTMKSRDYKDATDLVAQPIAFNSKDYGSDATTDMSPTLRSLGAYGANGGGSMAVAQPIPLDMMNIKGRPSDERRANRIGRGYGEAGDPMFTITKANHHGVAIGTDCYNGTITGDISMTLKCGDGNPAINQPTVMQPICLMDQGGSVMNIEHDMTGTLRRETHGHEPVAMQPFQQIADCLTSSYGTKWNGNASATNGSLFASQSMAVRRLTPRECERLQGFPDDYTNIPGAADGPRYKALGNSMAVPVMAWIGKRIANG